MNPEQHILTSFHIGLFCTDQTAALSILCPVLSPMMENMQRTATKMLRFLQAKYYKELLKELGVFHVKRREGEDMIAVFQYMRGGHKEDLFCIAPNSKTRNKGWKNYRQISKLEVRRNFLIVRGTKQGNSLPPKFMDVSSLEVFMKRSDSHLSWTGVD